MYIDVYLYLIFLFCPLKKNNNIDSRKKSVSILTTKSDTKKTSKRKKKKIKMQKITKKQLEEFTSRPLLGMLGTVNPHNAPRVTPVFYEYYDGTFNVTSYANLYKIRNIRYNHHVSLVIVDTVTYGDTLTVIGTAKLTDTGIYEVFQRLNIRYLGKERGTISKTQYDAIPPRICIRITPIKFAYRKSMESPPDHH